MIALIIISLQAQILIVNLGNLGISEAFDGGPCYFSGAVAHCVGIVISLAIRLSPIKSSLNFLVVGWALR